MKNAILTIAVPTFNHHFELRKQLDILCPQISDEVELYIFDNNSTPPITYDLFKDTVNIIYNSENIGADANIFKCFKHCKTKWLWVLSDNDFIKSNAVQIVLSEIKSNNQAIFINFENTVNTVTNNLSDFFKTANYINSFTISNSIFNIHELESSFSIYEGCINTHQAQLLFLIKHLENQKKTCIFSSMNIIDNSKLAQWSKYAFIIDSLNIYSYIESENLSLFRRTLGKQVIRMQLFLLIESFTIDGLTRKNYILTFIKIIKKTKPIQFLSKGFVKLILSYIFFLFIPKVYSILYPKRIAESCLYNVNNSNWNY